jgi:microcystin-dependent protein
LTFSSLANAFYQTVESVFDITFADQRFYQAAQTLMPCGTVLSYMGSSTPNGFLLCNGQLVSRTNYANLFALVGTTYGTGDGSTTFAVPNLQGCFLRGNGSQTIGGVVYSSGSLGINQLDSMQGHLHTSLGTAVGASSTPTLSPASGVSNGAYSTTDPIADSSNGTPRTAAETRPVNYSTNFIIAT